MEKLNAAVNKQQGIVNKQHLIRVMLFVLMFPEKYILSFVYA